MIPITSRVLVTGGTGFLGSRLATRMARGGAEVTTLARSPAAGARHVVLDVLDPEASRLVAEGSFDLVAHFAGGSSAPTSLQDPLADARVNLLGPLAVLEAARRAPRPPAVLLASSAAVYGEADLVPTPESQPLHPLSPYGASKAAAEAYAATFSRLYGLRTASLRLFSVYGPGQGRLILHDVIEKLRRDRHRLEVLGTGTEVRDFIHVGDAVEAAIQVLAAAPMRGEAYNVGTGVGTPIRDLVALVCETMDARPEVRWTGSKRPGDPKRLVADIERLRSLGWSPRINLEDGLREMAVLSGPVKG